ncbi:phosphotransferase family protein [Flavisphingomonas formosensis]|uniref:phosphotransferase family protein n=1 Tax=Flavisphingomonas formosensis TaxID=861534 RepID=UPI0012FA718F|nr:phosphotransferase family protein [Sphingomonas formosensis]
MTGEIAHDREAWAEVVDLDQLARWMDAHQLSEGAPIEHPVPLGGGTQNILLRFSRAGRDYVLRRPPRRPRPESDEVMRREMQVLSALAMSDVPHAGFIAGESDPTMLGCAFFLMEPVAGFNATAALPPLHSADPDLRRRMGEAIVDGAVALSRIDPNAVGLDKFGKINGWLERQVSRWRAQIDGYDKFEGWPGGAALPDLDAICAWLEANRPSTMQPGLIHGDYHLGNVMYRCGGPELAAIIDWELASRGDPLLDLGWLAATWPDPDETDPAQPPVSPWTGFPTLGEVVERYLSATGRSAADAHWYAILALFKFGAIIEGSYARACAGLTPKPVGDQLHAQAITLFNRALRRMHHPII